MCRPVAWDVRSVDRTSRSGGEVLHLHVDERRAVHVAVADEVAADVDPAGVGRDPVGVLVHGGGVEGVDDPRVDVAAGPAELVRHAVERGLGTAGRCTRAPASAKALATAEPIDLAP
jgi:hypothetical protein